MRKQWKFAVCVGLGALLMGFAASAWRHLPSGAAQTGGEKPNGHSQGRDTAPVPASSVKPGFNGKSKGKRPNIVYFLVDNLGFGELGCYGGGVLRGTKTSRIDKFASQGLKLLNFAPESQCTPSRSALMTGRYAIRSGNHTVMVAGSAGGLVAWEKTIADILCPFGYVTWIVGKWHIGDSPGRWPTDHGFDGWYGIPHSYDECLWPDDPWYNPKRDPVSRVLEGKKGGKVRELEQLTVAVRRDIDVEYMQRAKAFLKRSVEQQQPFFLYFNHSMMHFPTVPRAEFKGKTGNGDFADCLLELDSDFGALLDYLEDLGVADNTIVVLSGDNGPEEMEPWRGTAGFFEGSYFSGSEGNLRTPCIIRYPGKVAAGTESNDIVHITDMFPTLLRWAGAVIPADRVIDGKDQREFFEGKAKDSARDGFPYWMGPTLYGVKWRNFKMKMVEQKYLTSPAVNLPNPHLINLVVDPKERNPFNYPHVHSWVAAHMATILRDFQQSVQREPLIPAGAALDYVPGK
jgi:arylsulfatase